MSELTSIKLEVIASGRKKCDDVAGGTTVTTIDDVHDVLADVRVVEMSVLDRNGIPSTRPMASAWLPDDGQVVITTPLAYPQKVLNLRRDNRVALLYSDFTGTGLTGRQDVLVRGTASAPDVVATPQDLPRYWQELFRKSPGMVEEFATDESRSAMDWYYWRLPILVTPNSVEEIRHLPEGGNGESWPPQGASVAEQVADALTRYRSAVLAARGTGGSPTSARVRVAAGDGGDLKVETPDGFGGVDGPASLLWHLHDGVPKVMMSLQVIGELRGEGSARTLTPERIPGAAAWEGIDSDEAWISDGRTRTQRYLDRHGLTAAPIDWDALARLAPSGHSA